jgi:hypothetical protein
MAKKRMQIKSKDVRKIMKSGGKKEIRKNFFELLRRAVIPVS